MAKYNEQIKSRKESNKKAFKSSFLNLAGMEKNAKQGREDFIVSQLLNYFKIQGVETPSHVKTLEEKIEYLANIGLFVGRKIELNGMWHLDYREPILVFTKDTGTPILLIPRGGSTFYYISYETGKKVIGTMAMSRKLKKEAYVFYRPLPSHKLTLREYFKFFRKSVRLMDFVWVTIFSIVATAVGMLLPYIMKMLTGEVVQNANYEAFRTVAIYLVGAGLGFILIKSSQAFMNARIAIKIEKLMQEATMMRLMSLPPSFFKKYSTGELVARFTSVSALSQLIFNGVFLTFLSTLMSLAYMTQIVQFTPYLVLPVVLILVITTIFNVLVSLIQIKVSRKQMRLSAKENGTSYAIISGIQKIRLAGAEKRAFAKWANDYAKSSRPLYNPPLIIRLSAAISLAIGLIGQIIIYVIASKNSIDVSSFMAFTASFGSLSAAASSASEISNTLARVRPVLDMARPILEAEEEDNRDKKIIETLKGNIKLDHLTFRYDENERNILEDINLEIHEGEYVGVVGKTGCGKSTLVRLLLGFEKPTEGTIYYDKNDISTLNLQSLRSKIGSVTQNGGIFHADIMSNILITAPHLKEEDAWEAATTAGIASDIREMPMKMKTVISEGQGGISGGQKQRIMIARAIVNKPKVLIFDEATSALDNVTQNNIAESINKLNCTRIVIAHRLSTIKHCDRIIYMEDGKIMESGNYEELIAKKGKFFELVERQRLDE